MMKSWENNRVALKYPTSHSFDDKLSTFYQMINFKENNQLGTQSLGVTSYWTVSEIWLREPNLIWLPRK